MFARDFIHISEIFIRLYNQKSIFTAPGYCLTIRSQTAVLQAAMKLSSSGGSFQVGVSSFNPIMPLYFVTTARLSFCGHHVGDVTTNCCAVMWQQY
jgi:hypothetical protein